MTDESDPRGAAPRSTPAAPFARATGCRQALVDCLTPDDLRDVARALLERAKAGDVPAARLLLDRVLGSEPMPDWPSAKRLAREVGLRDL